MTQHKARKSIGWFLTGLAGYAIAWNQPAILESLGSTLTLFVIIFALAVVVLGILVMRWPSGWPERIHSPLIGLEIVLVVILTVAVMSGGMDTVLGQLPKILLLIVCAVVVVLLFAMAVLDQPRSLLRSRRRSAN